MKMTFNIKDDEDHIKLGQLLKAAGIADTGSEAKEMILEGEVLLNGEVCLMRGKKIYKGDRVSCRGKEIEIL